MNQYQKCNTMMNHHRIMHTLRVNTTVMMMIANPAIYLVSLNNLEHSANVEDPLVILFGIFVLLLSAAIAILSFFTTVQRPVLLYLICALLLLGICSQALFVPLGVLLLVFWLTQFLEISQHNWLRKQPGYPQFSELFEALKNESAKGYQPDYQLDGVRDAVMKDAFEENEPESQQPQEIHAEDSLPDELFEPDEPYGHIPDLPDLPDIPKL